MAVSNKTHLKIITPHGIFWDKEVEIVTVRTTEGDLGVLYGRSPMVASLAISHLTINSKGKQDFKECAISGGVIYITKERVDIITDAIEAKESIDVSRAERAKRQAEQMLKQKTDENEHKMATLALQRAINRISIKKG